MKRKYRKHLNRLESPDAQERYDAVLKLGLFGDTELIDTLDKVATLDESMKVRELADKAVRTLEVLKQRQAEQARAAQMAADDDDGGIEWRELASVKMLESDIMEDDGGSKKGEDWNFVESKKRDLERKREQAERQAIEAQIEAERRKRAAQRRRMPFRIVLFAAVGVALIGLAIVIWYNVAVEPPPETRDAVLSDLQIWNQALQQSGFTYQEAFDQPSFACAEIVAVEIAAPPRWVTLTDVGETEITQGEGVLAGAADDLSAVNESLLEGYEEIIFNIDRAHSNLTRIEDALRVACDGPEEITAEEWAQIEQIESLGGLLIQALRSANGAASLIETAQADLAPVEVEEGDDAETASE